MYHFGTDEWEKLIADVFMLVNLVLRFHYRSKNWVLKIFRMYRATSFFIAVLQKGASAFWEGKEHGPQQKG
jgi:hypothetical protein